MKTHLSSCLGFCLRFAMFAVSLGLAGAAHAADSLVTVTNTQATRVTLSDLYVYGPNPGDKTTILQAGNSGDDIVLNAGTSRSFLVHFVPTSYLISQQTPGGEVESQSFNVKASAPHVISFLTDPADIQNIVASTDSSFVPPPDGTTISFTDGVNGAYPGITADMTVDTSTGIVSDPYTGSAVFDSPFDVTVSTPEPGSVTLLSGLSLTLLVGVRRRYSRRRPLVRR